MQAQYKCRHKDICLMNGNLRVENGICKCAVSDKESSKEHVYIGVAEGGWKQRYYNHTMSLRNHSYKNDNPFNFFIGT